eukprot:TRINITY_DN2903_c0_g1_i1.p1 TRINITY_DN2903_c0_g1~~TRINITY_DN2903_c0_g1_i1.p1  ORF type:complete len:765 (+),score=215.08 TRINITY_DN2903_c0_g1_i1:107-2296(+)
MMTSKAGFILLLASAVTAITPTEKVIDMLKNLQNETETAQATEKKNFDNFTKWCDDTSDKKNTAIKNSEDREKELLSNIESKTSNLNQLLADLSEANAKKEQLEAEKTANLQQCSKDKDIYDATKGDLDAAIGGLQAAIKTLREAGGEKSLFFLQLASGLQQSLDLGEAMGLLQEPKHQAMMAFLQEGKAEPWLEKGGEEYNKTDYGFQSGGIVQTLLDLDTQFTNERDSLVNEWKATQAVCDKTDKDKKEAIEETSKTISSKTTESNSVKDAIAGERGDLQKTRATLKEDRSILKEAQEDCARSTADYGQRSKNRAGEIKAIQAALKVMKDTVQELETNVYNYSSLLSTNAEVTVQESDAPSFFQEESLRESHFHVASEMSEAEAEAVRTRTNQAVSFLVRAGGSLKSLRLSQLAFRIQSDPSAASDPLAFVKQMTEKMINDLQKEATAATTQKGWCDTQMMKSTKERDRRFRESLSLDKKLKALDVKRSELIETIALQKDDIKDMEKDLSTAISLRVNESTENIKTINDATLGGKAVDAAITALNDFYKKAQRSADRYDDATSFLQRGSEAATEDPGFEGSYKGKQNEALSVVTLMEVIRDSFIRSAKETQAEEDEASEKFTELKQNSKVDIESKRKSMTLNDEDLAVTTNDLSSGKEALQNTVKLLDSALAALEDLKDECVNNQMTYEERKAKREGEIAQLKQAVCILDSNNVEPDCKKASTAAAS